MSDLIIRTSKKDLQTGKISGGGITITDLDTALLNRIIGDGIKKITVGTVPPVLPDPGDIYIDTN